MLEDLVRKTRSYRRFVQDSAIDAGTLRQLVNLARLSASAANLQPLKYRLFYRPEENAVIFPHLAWAGYLKDWPGPSEGQRPAAYILILGDKTISRSFGCDHGIAAQSILLGAREKGLGGCMIGSIDRPALRQALQIPTCYEILLVLALGKPGEKIVLEAATSVEAIHYWRDAEDVHHVPKRSLDEIILT